MTDVQVSKLSRRDLLEILLAVETDNNALQQELSELREQLQQLKQDQERNDSGLADAGIQAATLLQEARTAADAAAARQREALTEKEQRLQEWERRLQERETWLKQQESRRLTRLWQTPARRRPN